MADDVAVAPLDPVTVNASQPGGVPTTTSDVPNQIPQSGGTPPPQAGTPAPAQGQPPAAQQQPAAPPQKHGLAAILAAVGDALAGGATRKEVNPQTGAIEEKGRSTGAKVGSAISTLLMGAAAGAAQHGPGSIGRSALAGGQVQQEAEDRRNQQRLQESQNVRETNDAAQRKLLTQASLAKSNQDMARGALQIKAEGRALDEHEAAIADTLQKVASVPGAQKLAHFDSNDDINSHLEQVGPDIAKQYAVDVSKNEIRIVPNPKGGFDAYQLPKDWHNQPIGEGQTVHAMSYATDPKSGKITPTMTDHAAPATMTWGEQQEWEAGQFTRLQSYNEAQTKQAKEQAETGEANANAKKAIADALQAYAERDLKLAQAKNLSGGNAKNEDGSWNETSIPVALVEHNMDPSQLSKRSADYNAKIQQANEYSLAKYGKPFDLAQAQADYTYAKTPQTQNTLKLISGMTDPGGAIDIAQGAATALPKVNESTLNKVFNATATEFGSPEATNFHTAMLGLADEYSKVMGGGVSSDTGRQQALDILKSSYSKGQISGAIGIMRKDIEARKTAIVGNNAYLIRQHGAPKPPAPQGATNEVFDPKDGKTVIGHVVNGAYVPLAAH